MELDIYMYIYMYIYTSMKVDESSHGSKHKVGVLPWRLVEAPVEGNSMEAYAPSMEAVNSVHGIHLASKEVGEGFHGGRTNFHQCPWTSYSTPMRVSYTWNIPPTFMKYNGFTSMELRFTYMEVHIYFLK